MAADDKKRLGTQGEAAAARYLEERGYAILARNYRKRSGEVDIVAQKDGILAFIEVKTRSSSRFGSPAEAVGTGKRRRICSAALHYISENNAADLPARFDVIEVYAKKDLLDVRHIMDAFAFEEP